jgi:1,4-alpha-glucan branching enzyme
LLSIFHDSHSIADYRFASSGKGTYKIILSTDDLDCGGFGRIDTSLKYHTLENNMLSIYLPSRTSVVMKKQS